MTQEEFRRLPLLLTPRMASEALGCQVLTLRQLRAANPELATMVPGMKQWRYVKGEIARLARLKFE
jgi:hypothetical protein